MYVLDTNTLIYFFKGMGRVVENVLKRPPGQIGIPAIVLYELEVGIAKSSSSKKRKEELREFASVVTTIPFSVGEAQASALIRTTLGKKGKPIGPLDVLIAGTALAHQSILITHNTKEFKRVPGLKVEDWY